MHETKQVQQWGDASAVGRQTWTCKGGAKSLRRVRLATQREERAAHEEVLRDGSLLRRFALLVGHCER
jgi:hypothetical protein